MVTLVKHEWHQCDVQYAMELDEALLAEIYPDMSEEELAVKMQEIARGEVDIDELMEDAINNDVDIEWDHQSDDMWTMRKGGYDVSYELGDDTSWHHEPEPDPPTHKCSNCKWTGQSYDAEWKWEDDNGNTLEEAKKVCPYCESDVVLTEVGVQKEKEDSERRARWAKEADEIKGGEEDLTAALTKLKEEFEQLEAENGHQPWPFEDDPKLK